MKVEQLLENKRKPMMLRGGFVIIPMFDSIETVGSPHKVLFRVHRLMDDGEGEAWIARSFGHFRWIVYFNGEEFTIPAQCWVKDAKDAYDLPALYSWVADKLNDESLRVY